MKKRIQSLDIGERFVLEFWSREVHSICEKRYHMFW